MHKNILLGLVVWFLFGFVGGLMYYRHTRKLFPESKSKPDLIFASIITICGLAGLAGVCVHIIACDYDE